MKSITFSENLVKELLSIPNSVKFCLELETLLTDMCRLEKWKLRNFKIV